MCNAVFLQIFVVARLSHCLQFMSNMTVSDIINHFDYLLFCMNISINRISEMFISFYFGFRHKSADELFVRS